MKFPRKLQKKMAAPRAKPPRATLYLTIALAFVLIVVLVSARILLNQRGESLILGPLRPILITIGLVSVGLVWRGWIIPGTSLLTATFFGGMAFAISQRSDLGLPLIISVTFLMAVLVGRSWPRRLVIPSMIGLTSLGTVLLLADQYWPVPRQPAPPFLQPVFIIAAGIMIVGVLALILRQFPDYSLRAKLIITLLTVTLIPITILSVLNNRYIREELINDASQILSTAASQTAITLDDFFNNGLGQIRSEATIMGSAYDWAYYRRLPVEDRSSLGILGETKAIDLLKTYRDKDPLNIVSYALLDMDGQMMFEYPPRDGDPDESQRSYYESVVDNGRPYVSPVEFSAEDGNAYFYFSALVVDDAAVPFGILRGQYKASVLQTLIARSTGFVRGQSFAVLFDENNLHLAHGTAPSTIYKLADMLPASQIVALQAERRLPDVPIVELSTNLPELAASLNDSAETPIFTATDFATGSQLNQVAVAAMSEQPWRIAFFQPQEVFLEPVRIQQRRTIILVLIISAGVVGVALTAAAFLTRPISALEAIAAKVAEGDFSVQAPVVSQDEVGSLAKTFNFMTARIHDLIGSLEDRVAARTRALEISGDVSRSLSTILDPQELVTAVVQQVQQAFNYYHAHIYLLDEARENLVMVGGTGKAGQTMLARQHQIPLGKGLVGRAGRTNDVVLVPDVTQADGWLPNPLLPDTKAEIAVPIASGEHIFGVLDVQHNVVDGLSEADASLLQSVANQAAVALQNARLYAQTQQAAQREAEINAIGQKIQGTTTVEEALQTAVRELGRVLQAEQTSVRLRTGDDDRNGNGRSA